MLLPPKLNVLFNHTAKRPGHAVLTLCSIFTSGIRETSDATKRYQRDYFTARTSNRQHTTKSRRYESKYKVSPNRGWFTHDAAGSKRSEILEWISNIPYTSHHKRIAEGRLRGTGGWLLEREEYRTWRSSSASKLLLLRGIRMSSCTFLGINS